MNELPNIRRPEPAQQQPLVPLPLLSGQPVHGRIPLGTPRARAVLFVSGQSWEPHNKCLCKQHTATL